MENKSTLDQFSLVIVDSLSSMLYPMLDQSEYQKFVGEIGRLFRLLTLKHGVGVLAVTSEKWIYKAGQPREDSQGSAPILASP